MDDIDREEDVLGLFCHQRDVFPRTLRNDTAKISPNPVAEDDREIDQSVKEDDIDNKGRDHLCRAQSKTWKQGEDDGFYLLDHTQGKIAAVGQMEKICHGGDDGLENGHEILKVRADDHNDDRTDADDNRENECCQNPGRETCRDFFDHLSMHRHNHDCHGQCKDKEEDIVPRDGKDCQKYQSDQYQAEMISCIPGKIHYMNRGGKG